MGNCCEVRKWFCNEDSNVLQAGILNVFMNIESEGKLELDLVSMRGYNYYCSPGLR